MQDEHREDHLSRISTLWTMIRLAHGDETEVISDAHAQIIERYSGAVFRYLLAVLRDRDAADEVFQEFALKLAKGGFRNADQTRGRFRDYVKVSVLRLVKDHHRRRQRQNSLQTSHDANEQDVAEGDDAVDRKLEESFLASCREELLGRTWRQLKEIELQTGRLLHTVLEFRSHHPDARSQQIADDLNKILNPAQPLSAAGIRKTIERARLQFSDLLLDEVATTLTDATPDEIEKELIDLGLHSYCAHAWQRRFGDAC